MNIQLKQPEIISALKQYIAAQGISLYNKTVDISFTAGRKESGLVADLVIEDGPATGTLERKVFDPVQSGPVGGYDSYSGSEPPQEPESETEAPQAPVATPVSLFN